MLGAGYANRVFDFRNDNKISRNMLATMLQVSPSNIAKVESGEQIPSQEWWDKFLYLERNYNNHNR
jgi:ribosome-binding protein aMBF1 (putative translation factor)